MARLAHKAFRKWSSIVLRGDLKLARAFHQGSQQELIRLREQCKAYGEQLRDVAQGSDLVASLLAEKALNRYGCYYVLTNIVC